jgi:hypothetical protein
LIVAIVTIPLVFLIICFCRKTKSVSDSAEAKKRMRISAAVEDVDWGLEAADQKSSARKGKNNNDLVVPFEHIQPELSNISMADDVKNS